MPFALIPGCVAVALVRYVNSEWDQDGMKHERVNQRVLIRFNGAESHMCIYNMLPLLTFFFLGPTREIKRTIGSRHSNPLFWVCGATPYHLNYGDVGFVNLFWIRKKKKVFIFLFLHLQSIKRHYKIPKLITFEVEWSHLVRYYHRYTPRIKVNHCN